MTSHPKDCTFELLDAMAECEKVSKHLHLPCQSGNDRVLGEMNRGYTREKYLSLIAYARKVMPDISLTSDIIVGFPGETYEEFCDTLSLIKEVGFTSLYTFIYSPREGTKAASMPDPVSREEKGKWFRELTSAQEQIASKRCQKMLGQTYRVLAEEYNDGILSGRTDGSVMIDFPGDESLVGSFCQVKVTAARNWILSGEISR
jgi:tRNA-2-methylthio-N6-dimethylallyladenosine synthase